MRSAAPRSPGRTGAALGLACLLSLLAFAAPADAASDKRIVIQNKAVISIGGFAPRGPDPSPAAVAAVMGPGTTLRDEGSSCEVAYGLEGLTVQFANFGGATASTCVAGKVQSFTASGAGWTTDRGLAVGDPVSKLQSLYREKRLRGGRFELIGKKSPFGPPGSRLRVLVAFTSAGTVTAFDGWVGAAGE